MVLSGNLALEAILHHLGGIIGKAAAIFQFIYQCSVLNFFTMGSLNVSKRFLRPLECLFKTENTAVLALNGTGRWPESWKMIWDNAVYRVCTDGAGNAIENLVRNQRLQLPHLLCGDFDSITDKALKMFERNGVCVQETPDQNFTDMGKALQIMAREIAQKNFVVQRIVVLGGLSGRIDHTLSSFQSLLYFRSISDCPIYMVDDINLITILTEGESEIQFDEYADFMTRTAGFIPFCQRRTVVTSEGFKWDLTDKLMEFGGCISTSNRIERDTVIIKTTAPLIFTLELTRQSLE